MSNGCSGTLRDFVLKVLHGDTVHRRWLLDAAEAYIRGEPIAKAINKEGVIDHE